MTRPIDQLAVRRQLLVARSSLCRLKLRHEFEVVRWIAFAARALAVARMAALASALLRRPPPVSPGDGRLPP
jgi:hypothetical protein